MKEYIKKNIGFIFVFISIVLFSVSIVWIVLFPSKSENTNENVNEVDSETPSESTDNNNDEDNPDQDEDNSNTNEGVISDKELGNLKFTNTSLVTNDDGSMLTTLVSNTSNEDIKVNLFSIFVKDKDNKVIVVLDGYVGGVIPAGSSKTITSYTDVNLENAVNIEYQMLG
jgi:competence protein ComGC